MQQSVIQNQPTYVPVNQHVQSIVLQSGSPVNSGNRKYEGLMSKPIIILSGIQITVGVLCMLFNAIGIGLGATTHQAGHGIWCGIMFIITGAFGVCSGRQKTLCVIVTFMVLSIISAALTIPLLILSSIGLTIDHNNMYYNQYTGQYYTDPNTKAMKSVHIMLLLLSLIEAIVAIVSASFCCHGVCCCRSTTHGAVLAYPNQTVQYVTNTSGGHGQVFILQGGPVATAQPQLTTAGYAVQGCSALQTHQPVPIDAAQARLAMPPQYRDDPPPEYDPDYKQPL